MWFLFSIFKYNDWPCYNGTALYRDGGGGGEIKIPFPNSSVSDSTYLWYPFIVDRCHRRLAVVTPVIYERGIQQCFSDPQKLEIRYDELDQKLRKQWNEGNGLWLGNPPPLSYGYTSCVNTNAGTPSRRLAEGTHAGDLAVVARVFRWAHRWVWAGALEGVVGPQMLQRRYEDRRTLEDIPG